MNLLVIDDDISTVDRIVSMIDKNKLGFESVYSAYNIDEAKDIFRLNQVDILLCDIEMPCGSGLDLIEWIRNNGYDTISIILTSYAEFYYAKKALELGSFEYLLKPAPYPEIEKTLVKAINKFKESQSINDTIAAAEYWDRNKAIVTEQFFRELVKNHNPQDIEAVTEQAQKKNIRLYADSTYTPILIQIDMKETSSDKWDKSSLSYAVQNIASEIIFQNDSDQFFVTIDERSHIVILRDFTHTSRNLDSLKQRCENFLKQCDMHLSCNCCCYIGFSVFINLLGQESFRLEKFAENNVSYVCGCFFSTDSSKSDSSYSPPDKDIWQPFFIRGDTARTISALFDYLDSRLICCSAMQNQKSFLRNVPAA